MSVLFAGGFTAVSPVLPEVMDVFGVSATQAGLLLSLYAGARMVFALPAGMLGDRLSVARTMALACSLAFAGSGLAVWTSSFGVLLLARVLQGAGTVGFMVGAVGHIIDVSPPDRVPRFLAWNQSLMLVGLSLGPTLGGLSATVWGYRGPFVLYTVYGFLGLAATVMLRSERRPEASPASDPNDEIGEPTASPRALVLRMLRNPLFIAVLIVSLIAGTMRAGIRSTVVPLFAADLLSFDAMQLGFLLTSAGIANLVIMYPVARSVEVGGWRRVMAVTTPLCAIPLAAFAFVSLEWQMYTVLALLAMISAFSAVVAGTAVAEFADISIRKTMVGVERTVRDFASMASPVAATAVAESFGFEGFFLGAALLTGAVGIGIAIAVAKERPRR